jgi:hypothetical protein
MEQDIVIDIIVANTAQRDAELNRAVQIAAECASQEKRRGIVVTRHNFSRFTVKLTPEVPFGLIQENDLTTN